MITCQRSNIALLGGLCALALLPFGSSVPRAENLPVFTSPIDVTPLRLQIRGAAPHRDTGQLIDVTLPFDQVPKLKQLFTTPLSVQLDQFWNTKVDPKTGMTPRQAACDGKDGIKQQVPKVIAKIGSGYSSYDISCNLATKGQLLAKQVGSTMYLAYQLTNNMVSFRVTSPYTCHPGTPGPCPNDARITVHFATQLVTVIRTPDLCHLTAEGGTVYVVAASIETQNAAAEIARRYQPNKFIEAELGITATVKSQPLPIDDAFNELRNSPACKGTLPGSSRVLNAFGNLETQIDMRQGIILRAVHVGIRAPSVDAPNPGAPSRPPSTPSFTRPEILLSQPSVKAGGSLQVRGQHFPPNTDLTTALPVTMQHEGYANNSSLPVCFGGVTELQWGPSGRPARVERLAGNAQGRCAPQFNAANLTPGTSYQFRARDCDPITCSPWSALATVTTARIDPNRGKVFLSMPWRLGRDRPLGSGVVSAQGTFAVSVIIPATTSAGRHTMRAVSGEAKTSENFQVIAATPAGGGVVAKGSMMMVFAQPGETGCPNRPIVSAGTDDTFMLFGSGFAPGTITIHLDTATGAVLGTAPVRPDGTFCGQMKSVPRAQAGKHTLVAVQNNAVVSQLATEFVPPSVLH